MHFSFYSLPSNVPQLSWAPGHPPATAGPAVTRDGMTKNCHTKTTLLRALGDSQRAAVAVNPQSVSQTARSIHGLR